MDVDDLAQRSDVLPGDGCRAWIDHNREVTVDVAGAECREDNLQPDRVEKGDGGQVNHNVRPAIVYGFTDLAGQDRCCGRSTLPVTRHTVVSACEKLTVATTVGLSSVGLSSMGPSSGGAAVMVSSWSYVTGVTG
jgi:hypothetical protein